MDKKAELLFKIAFLNTIEKLGGYDIVTRALFDPGVGQNFSGLLNTFRNVSSKVSKMSIGKGTRTIKDLAAAAAKKKQRIASFV